MRWLIVPIAAYLIIALLMPLANGGALRGEFWRHAGWVVAGCIAVVGIAVLGGLAAELARGGALRVRHLLGGLR